MKNNRLLYLIYLAPEYIVLYIILKAYSNPSDILIISLSLLYVWIVLSHTDISKKSLVQSLILLVLPPVITLAAFPDEQQILLVLLLVNSFSIFRSICLYLFPFQVPYTIHHFFLHMIIFMSIIMIVAKSMLVFYAILLRLILVITSSLLTEETLSKKNTRVVVSSVFVLSLTPVFIKLIPITMTAFNSCLQFCFQLILGNKNPSMTGTNVIVAIIQFLFDRYAQLTYFVVKNQKVLIPLYLILVAIGLYYHFLQYAGYKQVVIYGNYDKHGQLKKEEETFQFTERREGLKTKIKEENLPIYRRIYKRLLFQGIQKGFSLDKQSTSRQFREYLVKETRETADICEVTALYEKERYGGTALSEYRQFETLCKKAAKAIHKRNNK